MVRGQDAHAWPEVFVGDVGWLPLDIIPKKSLAPAREPADQTLQQMLGEMARGSASQGEQRAGAAASGEQEAAGAQQHSGGWRPRWLLLLLVLAVALLYAVKLYRRYAPYLVRREISRLVFRGLVDRLGDAGLRRRRGQSWETFSGAVQAVCGTFAEVAALRLRQVLGTGAPLAREEQLRLYRTACVEIASRAPRSRRLLGALDPLSWWWN